TGSLILSTGGRLSRAELQRFFVRRPVLVPVSGPSLGTWSPVPVPGPGLWTRSRDPVSGPSLGTWSPVLVSGPGPRSRSRSPVLVSEPRSPDPVSGPGLRTRSPDRPVLSPVVVVVRLLGYLSVMMNCQWQSLLCQVDGGLLHMFGEEEEESEAERSPQYTIPLRGCEVRSGPDTEHWYRITLSSGDQVAMLEVSCSEEKQRWLKVLRDGAADGCRRGNKGTQESRGGASSGLQLQRFPTSNTYMDDPFQVRLPQQDQRIYSNSSVLEHQLSVDQGLDRTSADAERGVQKLELTGRTAVQLRAGSEANLSSAGRHNKRTFRQSLAVCTERAQVGGRPRSGGRPAPLPGLIGVSLLVQAGFLNPLLRRTASAKSSLRRAPSALLIQHGKVFQRRKVGHMSLSSPHTRRSLGSRGPVVRAIMTAAPYNYSYIFKYIIIGDMGVGKSCLLHQFTEKKFMADCPHTIGVEFGTRIMEVHGQKVKLQIWDTAGQERFRAVTRSYYRGAAGALMVYDITRRSTYNHLSSWLTDARNLTNPNTTSVLLYQGSVLDQSGPAWRLQPPDLLTCCSCCAQVIILIGNKADLEAQRDVTYEEAKQFADENGEEPVRFTVSRGQRENVTFPEDSSLVFVPDFFHRGENVEEAFLEAAKRIYQNIQDGSLDLNAAESGVQHKPSAPQGGRLNAESQAAKEGCSC
uniref:PH domain-containing protein n=1 Tax=Tetraodon nigroviridis TaxID=99883 RepID=H3DQU2_TETNG